MTVSETHPESFGDVNPRVDDFQAPPDGVAQLGQGNLVEDDAAAPYSTDDPAEVGEQVATDPELFTGIEASGHGEPDTSIRENAPNPPLAAPAFLPHHEPDIAAGPAARHEPGPVDEELASEGEGVPTDQTFESNSVAASGNRAGQLDSAETDARLPALAEAGQPNSLVPKFATLTVTADQRDEGYPGPDQPPVESAATDASEAYLLEASRDMLDNKGERPTAQRMSNLILRGLKEDTLYDAWGSLDQPAPDMEETLTELDTLGPFIHTISDTLADTASPNETLLFAARDAELLHDDFTIVHGGQAEHRLMPASQPLWSTLEFEDTALMEDFLEKYGGVTEAVAGDPDTRLSVVDTGFHGTIASFLDEAIIDAFRTSLLSDHRMTAKLACAHPNHIGNLIADYEPPKNPRANLPKSAAVVGPPNYNQLGHTYLYAVALQLMPHHHGAFNGVKRQGSKIYPTVRSDPEVKTGNRDLNASYVNPLAASIVQYRVVASAMRRTRTKPAPAPRSAF